MEAGDSEMVIHKGYLYLADHGSTDCGLADHVYSQFQAYC